MSASMRLAMQFAGRGRLEGHPPGDVDGVRFEGRFVIYAMNEDSGPVFGEDVSLFDADAVAKHGRGAQSAHFVAVRSGRTLEGFTTGEGEDFPGHQIGRASAATRMRIYFDAAPDGSRDYEDRASFLKGECVATYRTEEYFQINPVAGVFDTRCVYSILESTPLTFNGRTVDLGALFPRMIEHSHGQNPAPDPDPEPIPMEEPFLDRGPGVFADRFAVGGTLFATD